MVRLSALRTGRPLPPRNVPGTHFCWRLSRPQGHNAIGRILRQWNIPMTPPGIEPAAFWFVVQHLNHCVTAVPRTKDKHYKIKAWSMRENSVSGKNCVRNLPLGDKDKILLLPLHITMVLTKNFVKLWTNVVKVWNIRLKNFRNSVMVN